MKSLFLLRLPLALSIVMLVGACARNPVTGKRGLSLMSTEQEIALGKQSDPQIQSSYGVYEDARLQQFITEKGMAMAKSSHRPDLPWQFRVVDSPVVNAFAVPGGFVYFTRGIMAHFNDEAQFAGVLGHEIGHVTARHGASQQTQQLFGQLGLIGAMIAVPGLAQYGQQLSQGLGLLFLKFGRDDETQSDKLGVEYSTKIGYDAKHMAGFFSTLKRLSEKEGAGLPTFLSTHPDPGQREQRVMALAQAEQTKNPGSEYKINRESYLNMIEGIIYGDDPKQGFVEANVFYHPELKFQFPVPSGWRSQNSPTQFQMGAPDGKAMMVLTLAPGKTLDEAAKATVQQLGLQVMDSQRGNIDGNPAIVMVSTQMQQQQQGQPAQAPNPNDPNAVRVMTYLIQYNNAIYAIHGLTYAALFQQYSSLFQRSGEGFRRLSDPDKLNRQPERIRLKRTARAMTFTDAMTQWGMPTARLEELAILNGMQRTENVPANTLLKTIGK